MGHVYAVIIFFSFIAILAGKLYFSYLSAIKHTSRKEAIVSEIPDEGLRFAYSRKGAVFFSMMAIAVSAFFIVSLIKSYKPSDSDLMSLFWLLFGISFPAIIVVVLAAIKGFRSYLRILREGFEYRETFRVKWYPKERIEGVYHTSEFIFIRLKGRRLPIIIENGYGDNKLIFGLISGLAGQGSVLK